MLQTNFYFFLNKIFHRETYMGITILYVIIGLAFTTIAIDIAADTLRKMHYFGRKIKNFGDIEIWFGGKKYFISFLIAKMTNK